MMPDGLTFYVARHPLISAPFADGYCRYSGHWTRCTPADTNDCRTPEQPCRTISEAMDQVNGIVVSGPLTIQISDTMLFPPRQQDFINVMLIVVAVSLFVLWPLLRFFRSGNPNNARVTK